MSLYVCYDLRAIQGFIFRIPKLRYIVGGSAIIDAFDREVAPKCGRAVFCAGGKGAFSCDNDDEAKRVERELVRQAWSYGLDVRLGCHMDFSEASHCADRLYSFVPEGADGLEGHPCQASGLYPVAPNAGRGPRRDIHEVVERRIFVRGESMLRRFEDRLIGRNLDLGPGAIGLTPTFFRSVDPRDGDPHGQAGAAAIGTRKRWAIICMDGNDMGGQFRSQHRELRHRPDALRSWIAAMSSALDDCSLQAAAAGIESVAQEWMRGLSNQKRDQCAVDGELVLPIRPLVVGGDDIVVLCHASFAFGFVRAAVNRWDTAAARLADAYKDGPLWPASGNRLSISAGVLFAPSSLPLHVAIPYAESLLASAKQAGRRNAQAGRPSPAAIDWESVTESILDTPSARRQRALRFMDEDIQAEVRLTKRPYTLTQFEKLTEDARRLGALPRSLRHDIAVSLRSGWNDRELFRLRLGKRHGALSALLDERPAEPSGGGSSWSIDTDTKVRTTWVLDAIGLLEEEERTALAGVAT